MNTLKNYVDGLFSGYGQTKDINELKDEILSNLEAKVSDLTAGGMEYKEAMETAKKSIHSVDNLIDGNVKVYVNKYKLELLQIMLLYFIIDWILTMPLIILRQGITLHFLMFIASVTAVILYINGNSKKTDKYLNMTQTFNIKKLMNYRKIAWLIFILFIVVYTFLITGFQFGSNIWFLRHISIDGPFQFATICTRYLMPFTLVIVPLYFNLKVKLIYKYETDSKEAMGGKKSEKEE